ncbi:MAG: primosomal protein N' (replication factor Y), partial [Gammaproteobacteria bacterium]
MTNKSSLILHISLPVPVRHHFDYIADNSSTKNQSKTGVRVLVPFGKNNQKVGIITGFSNTSDVNPKKLKPIIKIIDNEPLFDAEHIKLLRWASNYYHYPLGELIFATLPALLRKGKKAEHQLKQIWQLTEKGGQFDINILSRAVKQRAILNFIRQQAVGCAADLFDQEFSSWRVPLKSLVDKDLVQTLSIFADKDKSSADKTIIKLNDEQSNALSIINNGLNTDHRYLLDGITGSGKTEVYLEAIKKVIANGKQALVLVPEIGLTPHFISRFQQRIPSQLVVIHSGLSDGERLHAWLKARDGVAQVVLGTRSAVWTPLINAGLIIVDEEHDQSYKQQDSLRYSARDIAILRASLCKIPIILGSATPSLETLHNVEIKKITRITLVRRAENAIPPKFRIIDMRGQQITGALSGALINSISDVLSQKKQVLLFQNRRGYSPVLMCHQCNWINLCSRCDIPLTYHKIGNKLICHHCGNHGRPSITCNECHAEDMIQIGHGTERLYETLSECFPSARILRIDRDSTRRKGSMQDYFEQINSGSVDILVGTQILAKGHHFPKVTLVGIIDADRGLFSNDFRAGEKMAQLIVQVSGRSGRATDPGLVMIQTHYPDHPFLSTLVHNDYNHFASLQMQERKITNLPPYSYQALLRADSHESNYPMVFLESASKSLRLITKKLDVYGPFPAPIEKRAGRYRFQLLVQSDN